MSIELPDWIRGMLLLGRDGAGNIIPILVDAAGQINVLLRGEDALGTVRTVRVDNVGQLYAILRGAGGNDVSVDIAGNLSAILQGIDGFGALHTIMVDATGQAIMVPRGASGNYLDVDASGYLSAVLKGIYGGALHTIAVDVNGRIEAFLMDGADQWGKTLRIGMAELSARLNPLHTYDWRGNTLYECNFERGIPTGSALALGTGASITLDPSYWRTGGYSLKLVGGSTAGGEALWTMDQANPPARYLGFQVEFSNYPDGLRFDIMLAGDYMGSMVRSGLAFDFANNQLEYLGPALTWTDFYANTFVHRAYSFYRMKFVIDMQTGKYVRGLFLNKEIDMSAYTATVAGGVAQPYVTASLEMFSRLTFNDAVWVDSFVITTNEP